MIVTVAMCTKLFVIGEYVLWHCVRYC